MIVLSAYLLAILIFFILLVWTGWLATKGKCTSDIPFVMFIALCITVYNFVATAERAEWKNDPITVRPEAKKDK